MKRIGYYFIGWGILASMFLINHYLFNHLLKLDYFRWFMGQGAFISIISGLVYLLRDKASANSEDLGLISDHPLEFLGTHMQLLGLLFRALGDGVSGSRPTKAHSQFDKAIALIIIPPFALVLIGWFLIVIPCQFFVFFICGAPSRLFQTSGKTTLVEATMPSVDVQEPPKKTSFILDIKKQPFEFTNGIAALMLFTVNQFY